MIIFMDCCHSASILDIPYALETEPVGPKYVEDKSIGDIFGVSAAADDKVAYETAAGGVCTRAFIEAVRKLGKGALPAEVAHARARGRHTATARLPPDGLPCPHAQILLEMRQYAKERRVPPPAHPRSLPHGKYRRISAPRTRTWTSSSRCTLTGNSRLATFRL